MVIQRIQTLWLIIAMALTIISGFCPFVSIGEEIFSPLDYPIMSILVWLTAIIIFISVFLFGNLSLQKKTIKLGMLMTLILVITGGVIATRNPDAKIEWGTSVCLLAVSVIFEILAIRAMSRDQKRLRDSDRLWS